MRSKDRTGRDERISRETDDLKAGLAELKIDSANIGQLIAYLKLLHAYQNRINLISRNDYERIGRRHFLVSLMAYPYLKKARHVADLGSGAGFPGVPLKIVLPQTYFVLIESIKKRAGFLSVLIKELGLTAISVFPDRAEAYSNERFDTVLLRAAGKIKDRLRLIDRLLTASGQAIFYKGSSVADEIKDAQPLIDRLGFTCQQEKHFTPVEHRPLTLVILKKKTVCCNQ